MLENDVRIADRDHPVVRGLKDFRINDEFYYRLNLVDAAAGFHPLLTTNLEGKDETICWAWERPDGGRSFAYVGIHFHANWERLEYRRLVTQAILWTLDLQIPAEGVAAEVAPEVFKLPEREPPAAKKDGPASRSPQ